MNLIKINKPEYQPLLELIPNFVSFLDKRNTASDQRSCIMVMKHMPEGNFLKLETF